MISKEYIVSSSFVVFALNALCLSHPLSGNKFCKQKNIEILAWEHDTVIDADAGTLEKTDFSKIALAV